MAVPFGMLATTSVFAAEKTVFLSNSGDDEAAGTDAAPLKTMTKAYETLGEDGGIIVIKDKYTQYAQTTYPEHTGNVTIKGAEASAEWNLNGRVYFSGPTTIDNIKLTNSSGISIIAQFNNITVTNTVTCPNSKAAGGNQDLILVGGMSGFTADHTAKSFTMNINGGAWTDVAGPLWKGSVDKSAFEASAHEMKVTINVGDGAVVQKLFPFARLNNEAIDDGTSAGSCEVNLNGGKITHFLAAHDQKNVKVGYKNGLTVNIAKTFKLADSFNQVEENARVTGGIYYGIGGESVYTSQPMLENSKLVIAAEIYESVKDNSKLDKSTFKTVEKAGTAVTPPPTPPVQTGDTAWVVAAVMTVAAAGCTVILKKKA